MKSLLEGPTVRRRRVVILESDNGVRRALHLLLQGRGFDVLAYGSAKALLGSGNLDGEDFLVADSNLLGTDGIALLANLRAESWGGAAILITKFASEELEARAKMAGFSAVLTKPLKSSSVVAALDRLTPVVH